MHLKFKQAVCLKNESKKFSKDFGRGVHHLSPEIIEAISSSDTFKLYKELGLIEEVAEPVTAQLIVERNKAIVEKIEAPVEAEPAEPIKEQAPSKKKKR